MPRPDLSKMQIKALKAELKGRKMTQSGDKGTLISRLNMAFDCEEGNLKTPDGDFPYTLKFAKLKGVAAAGGSTPIGSQDEVLAAYVSMLKKAAGTNTGSNGSSSAGKRADPAAVMARVLELEESDDFLGILNLTSGGKPVSASSPVAQMRKLYLKLSLIIHPDKNSHLPDATKAFQALVRAFERLTQPEIADQVPEARDEKGKKMAKIQRSNVGCKRTALACPRCKVGWSKSKLEGNPDYFYNLMMLGLKTFCCATCLLEFGCMTALHTCPFCSREFEYSPSDFHRKISCGNERCSRTFGFYEYTISERVMKQLKIDIKREQEARAKKSEQRRRRAGRGRAASIREEETSFVMGLQDECPRCGQALEMYTDEEARRHLRGCTDEKKHTAHKKEKMAAAAKEQAAHERQEKIEEVQSTAAWRFLGEKKEQLWLLTDKAAEKECKLLGVDTAGMSKVDMIGELASQRASSSSSSKPMLLLGYEGAALASSKQPTRSRLTADSLPENYHSLSRMQLECICAAHGVKLKNGATKRDILRAIDEELTSETDTSAPLLLLTGPSTTGKVESQQTSATRKRKRQQPAAKRRGRQRRRAKNESSESENESQGSDSEYVDSDDEPLVVRKKRRT